MVKTKVKAAKAKDRDRRFVTKTFQMSDTIALGLATKAARSSAPSPFQAKQTRWRSSTGSSTPAKRVPQLLSMLPFSPTDFGDPKPETFAPTSEDGGRLWRRPK